jgi:hypothetical protein
LKVDSKGPTPQGNADEYQNKGLAGKAIRKSMKTKGEQKTAKLELGSEREVEGAQG